MGRLLYVDAFSGVAGDMMLGALVHAGAPLAEIEAELQRLEVPGWRLEATPKVRGGICGIDLRVHLEMDSSPSPGHAHGADHDHGHEEHSHHAEQPGVHRRLPEIEKLISLAEIPARAAERASNIFRRLAVAEGRVHGVPPEEVHFHEVGAVDAIIDIVGTAIALELLDVDRIYSSALALGEGFVRCAHGKMPVPVPATLELVRGFPVRPSGLREELVTPTGAAIVTTLAQPGPPPTYRPIAIGYGLGDRERENPPNLLRVVLGDAVESDIDSNRDSIVVLEANLDDSTGEVLGFALERLLAAGALDAYTIPIQMKKGRPGVILGALVRPVDAHRLEQVILSETTTLGVRRSEWTRSLLNRRTESVETPFGTVTVKWCETPAGVRCSPEYEDCRRRALDAKVPIWQVFDAARRCAERIRGES